MSTESDRRIQLRESVHQVVTRAANLRGVTSAAFVSMIVYEYLRDRGELDGIQFSSTTSPSGAKSPNMPPKPITEVISPTPAPKPIDQKAIADAWGDDDDADLPTIDLSGARYTPPLDASASLSELDEEDDFYEPS